uniref:Uncharacterized protein LOC111109676 n=1 Tax=Crassostrea virginica TaxID=6565 RepID=A0A8B8BEY0_CRAVI|nr:uncharacterized protein LOC111109676 [Crassostrea virginica]
MNRRVLFLVFFFILLFSLADSWLWRRRRRSYRAPVPKSTQIWDSARNKVGSTKWNYYSYWGEGYGYKKTWKCNLFVYDVLTEAKAKAPTKWSWLHRSPISANEWTNPNSKNIKGTGCYKTVSFSSKQKGDIIAFKRKRKSGHVGIVSTNGFYISALKRKVEEDNIEAFRRRHASIVKTIVWRYKC